MTSPTSPLLTNAAFMPAVRADAVTPASLRSNKVSPESSDSFAKLMKSYGAGQAKPPSPEFVSKPSPLETPTKPAAKPVAAPPVSETKTELQRQERKLGQKQAGQSDEGRARTPTAGTAAKTGASAALKVDAQKAPKPSTDTEAESPTRGAQAARSKSGDSRDSSADADASAALPIEQQIKMATAALGGLGPGMADAGKGLDQLRQGMVAEADMAGGPESQGGTAGPTSPLELEVTADAGRAGVSRHALASLGAAGQGRASLHSQATGGLATQQSQATTAATASGPAGEAMPNAGSAFASELLVAQGGTAKSVGESNPLKPEGFALEGMLSAAGLSPQAQAEAKFDTADVAQLSLSQPLTEASFAPEMAARLSVLAADGVQQAQLHLNPAEMGPVSVQIIVEGQTAQISFHAEHEQTRNILEQSLPDLAAALRDSGLTLSGGGVFQQPGDQNGGAQHKADGDAKSASGGRIAMLPRADLESAPMQIRQARGVVDLYA